MYGDNITLAVVPNALSKVDPANVYLQDKYGTIAEVNKLLLMDNHISVNTNVINLSIDLYYEWFHKYYEQAELSETLSIKMFIDNLDIILDSKKIILGSGKIAMAQLPFSYVYQKYWYCTVHLSLGKLINAWESGKFDCQCPYCNNMMKLLTYGYLKVRGYCFSCKRVYTLESAPYQDYAQRFYNHKSGVQAKWAFTFEEALAVLKYLNER